ncbi:MAG: HAMP domain-containing histidine kinase, partial [Firmicutes bacterium]|nr:HAMP domain-containing histidine kinase [Bacillota bacterium]
MRNYSFGFVMLISILSVLVTAVIVSWLLGAGLHDIYRTVLPFAIMIIVGILLLCLLTVKRSSPSVAKHENVSEDTREEEIRRRDILSEISHEMKTPLTTIRGYAELMENGMVPFEDIPDIAKKMNMESDHLLTMIERVLDSSRKKESSSLVTDIDMLKTASRVAERLESYAQKRSVSVRIEGDAVYLHCEKERMEQICYNLMENAIKYSKKNGIVLVSVGEDREGKYLTVADRGIGISENDQ